MEVFSAGSLLVLVATAVFFVCTAFADWKRRDDVTFLVRCVAAAVLAVVAVLALL